MKAANVSRAKAFECLSLEKTARLVGTGAIWIAGRLLRELAAEGKS
jgi:hypothetical protein